MDNIPSCDECLWFWFHPADGSPVAGCFFSRELFGDHGAELKAISSERFPRYI
jgi:hypothetical protein